MGKTTQALHALGSKPMTAEKWLDALRVPCINAMLRAGADSMNVSAVFDAVRSVLLEGLELFGRYTLDESMHDPDVPCAVCAEVLEDGDSVANVSMGTINGAKMISEAHARCAFEEWAGKSEVGRLTLPKEPSE